MNYSEKLKNPKWQKRRLEVLNAAGWACECCGDAESPLHVHHSKYTGEPWDAPAEDLTCVCEYHHKELHKNGGILLGILAHPRTYGRLFRVLQVLRRDRGMEWEEIVDRLEAWK